MSDPEVPEPAGETSVAKPRVLNDSPVDCQTPRCPSPQARQGGPLAVDEVESDQSETEDVAQTVGTGWPA